MVMIDKWITELIKDLELAPLPRGENGSYIITFDEIDVEIGDTSGGCSLFSTLGPIPQENPADFLTDAMNANLFGQGTDGAVLALSDDYKTVTLNKDIPIIHNYIDFRNNLEDFVNTAEFWIDKIKAKS